MQAAKQALSEWLMNIQNIVTLWVCCKQEGVLGIYANGTVYEPDFKCIRHSSEM